MNQMPLSPANSEFQLSSKRTRKLVFLEEMNLVVPWQSLEALIEPHYPKGVTGGPVIGLGTMLRVQFMQQWLGLSDPAMEEALHDTPIYRQFITMPDGGVSIPDETTILRFRHLFIRETQTSAPDFSHREHIANHARTDAQAWHFGMKAHIGIDTDSGLVHTVTATSGNAHDVTEAANLLHGQEHSVHGDAGYQGMGEREAFKTKHPQLKPEQLFTSLRRGKRKKLDLNTALGQMLNELETTKAKIRAFVEHPFRVIKCQFAYIKVRYDGIAKNAAQQTTLFALSNLWMARHKLMAY